jgi:hypothetical protein
MVDVKVGTFNVLNLARPGEQFYPDQRPYTLTEFDRKADWIAEQLRRMDADVVGFQEVFHAEALQEVCKRPPLRQPPEQRRPRPDRLRPRTAGRGDPAARLRPGWGQPPSRPAGRPHALVVPAGWLEGCAPRTLSCNDR